MPILIVDDEVDIRDSLKDVLNMAGYEVITASCGEEALEYLEREKVSVIIVDLCMPGMGGEKLLLSLVEKKERPQALVITALAPWRMLGLMEYGIGYVRKPINNYMLLSAIETLLRKEKVYETQGPC